MAVGLKKPILQVAGYQNSGKTTLMVKLIEEAKRQSWAVASFKHHGHGGTPALPENEKDSTRHLHAGALASGVEGGGVLNIIAAKAEWKVEEILAVYDSLPVDLLLLEGYKQADYPKIVLIRGEEEIRLLSELGNIQAVISWRPLPEEERTYPVFLFSEEEQYIQWFVQYMSCRLQRRENHG
ncbi:molybdopterin-guanine dinucleotide biosynthesis protein B [Bacillus thermotolerans]|uniref:Molybdopterin-guanine dinucleotide biosynthesis protein MobB n=1 Tax=Bacillus thermotolerans TaxID=1221996 RepID=A0A0F5I0Q1_BACTR|nr:molybdopterin-guanine dinucleotide biosynthesis protein B [Bacillus thermotolerans]KKB36828.1 Molybdopterin-guanine dinucleotide biosynthesis protein MobB [Bacillus thermotolerans]KKB39081.1 Molybdopterin-guanine dinucleotide biosynthesis protein MobB [Bacillus thermotolerans]